MEMLQSVRQSAHEKEALVTQQRPQSLLDRNEPPLVTSVQIVDL